MNDSTTEVTALTQQLSEDALLKWSDGRRKDFVDLFDGRVRASQYILLKTASVISEIASARQFISQKHVTAIENQWTLRISDLLDRSNANDHYSRENKVGGRPLNELDGVAKERATNILENLPPLKKAVAIINPEISAMIEEKEKIMAEGKKLITASEEISGPLDMDDFPQTMTLKAFRTEVKKRETRRKDLLKELSELGTRGETLDRKINKFLYSGLPGLSDAVVKVATAHLEKATGFSALLRRVSEKVQFGDSAAAMEALSSFEKDEVNISDEVKVQFERALETLKLSKPRSQKALKKG